MTTPAPKLSIGMPVYNGEKFLRAALDSLLQQDYADFELIISDNASTDATQGICREYAAKDPRIRYHRNETNIGASGNFNSVVKMARGEFFKWAAHDDVHLPGFLKQCMNMMEQAPGSVVLVTTKTKVIDEHGNFVDITVESLDTRQTRPHQRVVDVMRRIFWASALFGVFRMEALKKTRLCDSFLASDYVLLSEVAVLGEIWEVPELLFHARFHPGMSTKANKDWRELQAWFNPFQKGFKRRIPPHYRLGLEYLISFTRMRMSFFERLSCYLSVFTVWYARQNRKAFMAWRKNLALKTRLKKIFAPGQVPG
jgi:glycosyltransferase involved in cell wall biosynthesis